MENVETAPDLLRQAARLILKAKQQLNLNEKPCGECSCRVFSNPVHMKAGERIGAMPTKLHEVADTLEGNEQSRRRS